MSLLRDVRTSLLSTFVSLPLILIGFTGFTAIAIGMLGFFMLFIGQIAVLPAAVYLTHFLTKGLAVSSPIGPSNIGQLNPSAPPSTLNNVYPSFWMAHIIFFFGYIMMNAVEVLQLPKGKKISEWLYENRKTKAGTVTFFSILLAIILTYLRYQTGTETLAGIGIAWVVGLLTATVWFQIAKGCGIRPADVLGIPGQFVAKDATQAQASMVCAYKPAVN